MNDLREAVLTYKLAESRAKFVTGHVMCRPKTREAFEGRWIFITLLRDPVKRWISEFVYNTYGEQDWLRNTLPIDEYVDSPVGLVSATKYLEYFSDWRPGQPVDQTDVDRAVANLRRFAVVGTLENLPAFTADVVAILGRKVTVPHVNASPRRDMVQELLNQPDLVARVRWLCRHDKAVYDQVASGEPSPAGVVA